MQAQMFGHLQEQVQQQVVQFEQKPRLSKGLPSKKLSEVEASVEQIFDRELESFRKKSTEEKAWAKMGRFQPTSPVTIGNWQGPLQVQQPLPFKPVFCKSPKALIDKQYRFKVRKCRCDRKKRFTPEFTPFRQELHHFSVSVPVQKISEETGKPYIIDISKGRFRTTFYRPANEANPIGFQFAGMMKVHSDDCKRQAPGQKLKAGFGAYMHRVKDLVSAGDAEGQKPSRNLLFVPVQPWPQSKACRCGCEAKK